MSDTKPWGGRFEGETLGAVEEYTESVSYDWKLCEQDIAGSKAHARMLAMQGVISDADCEAIVSGLDLVLGEIESGDFVWRTSLEDVHMNIERRLTEIIGDPGKKLHTGRSRNDQVALDFRLKVAASLKVWREAALKLMAALIEQAESNQEKILPGCTHMQPAQPVSLAQHLLAYACMFRRDVQRMDDCLKRVMVSPLGAAALAGTTYPLDPSFVAHEVEMEEVFINSMDAVSDRDFVVEAVSCGALVMAHLSRMCEEIIIWANPNFGYLHLPDQYATGSSIMPQKKNPDVAELMRGKTGRVYGALMSLLAMIKGLPLAYNRDMQEDKEPFFDVDRTVGMSLNIMADMMAALGFNGERMEQVVKAGFLNATELADYLVGKGMPFREAHHVTGRAVADAEARSIGLEDMGLDELRKHSELIEEDVFAVLDYREAVARREVPGGTGPESVKRQISILKRWIANC